MDISKAKVSKEYIDYMDREREFWSDEEWYDEPVNDDDYTVYESED